VHGAITAEWEAWRESHPQPSRAEIEQQADAIDKKYGSTYWTGDEP
jgi:hypothetical protein